MGTEDDQADEGQNLEVARSLVLRDDVFVFCTDGIFEATDADGQEFGGERLCEVVNAHRDRPARAIVDAIFDAVTAFHGAATHVDDMTAVAVKITE